MLPYYRCRDYAMHIFRISVNPWPVDSSTVFLGDTDGLNHTSVIDCSPPYHRDHPYHCGYPHLFSWFYNGQLIENHTNSSLTVTYHQGSLQGFGVYQCFSGIHPYPLEEITITRVLLYGEWHACVMIDDLYHICNLQRVLHCAYPATIHPVLVTSLYKRVICLVLHVTLV